MSFGLKTYILRSGERYCVLLDGEGTPAFYPTLYVTSMVRNAGKATATMEQHLSAIKILLHFCSGSKIDLEQRIRSEKFLTLGEMDGLKDECQQKRLAIKKSKVVSLKNGYKSPAPTVESQTVYIYLTRIADYLKWLCELYLSGKSFTTETSKKIEKFYNAILVRRPVVRGRNVDDEAYRGVTAEQERRLFEVTQPGHPENPFMDPSVQVRNYLVLKLLRLTGARGGEVLNIQVADLDFATNLLYIKRRADAKEDCRARQPRVKTRQRALPLAQSSMEEIRFYIVEIRKRIPNSAKHPYLLVSHKSGPSQGQPLSVSSLQEMFNVIGAAHPELTCATAHDLRHRWNVVYSEAMDKTTHKYEEVEQWRTFLAGWAPGSKQGQHYNARHVRVKAHKAMLDAQEAFSRRVRSFQGKEQPEEA